jgi:hypothetical protein
MGPAAVADFLDSPYNRVADVKMLYFFERLSPFALKALVGLVLLSIAVPYSWCRNLCLRRPSRGAVPSLSDQAHAARALLHRLRPVHEGLPVAPARGAARARALGRVLLLPVPR